jgi:hypothetical protein
MEPNPPNKYETLSKGNIEDKRDSLIMNPRSYSEIILKILSDAEPYGMGNDEFRRLAKEKGISEADLDDALKPLLTYANIYFNASNGKYHFMWSSALQYE